MAVRLRVILTVFLMTGAVVVASMFSLFGSGTAFLRRTTASSSGVKESPGSSNWIDRKGCRDRAARLHHHRGRDLSATVQSGIGTSAGRPRGVAGFPWIDISPDEIGRVAQLIEQKMAELRSTIELRRSGGFDAAVPVIRAGSGKQLDGRLRAEMARLKERQVSGLKADAILSDRTTRTRTLVFLSAAS